MTEGEEEEKLRHVSSPRLHVVNVSAELDAGQTFLNCYRDRAVPGSMLCRSAVFPERHGHRDTPSLSAVSQLRARLGGL